jgi:ribosomal protein S12 methylthiotransferase
MPTASAAPTTVHVVSLGCARNDVDSEELAARLADGGFGLTADPEQAEAVVVNTCGFVESAKKDSVDTLLAAADLKDTGRVRAVVAVGCLAERYGHELAEALPEADAVLSFDDYPDVAARLRAVLSGQGHRAHVPRDRRTLLPLAPLDRPAVGLAAPGHGPVDLPAGLAPASGPPLRRRLSGAPWAPLKLASGCDRRCSFCAIPSFRGAYLSRPVADVLAEARWLAQQGVREVLLVSENSTSYGKDLGDLRLLETLLSELAAVDGLEWVRVSYLQPAEMRPGLIEVIAGTPGIVPYFDLSFQHVAPSVLRRMRRFGNPNAFLDLLDSIRSLAPEAGIRSNVICGFPGETEDDIALLREFLIAAELDVVGVFGYSDEDGTEAARLDGQLEPDEIERRRRELADLTDELVAQRAESRIGSSVSVLIEEVLIEEVLIQEVGDDMVGRAEHQGPEVDGTTTLVGGAGFTPGEIVTAAVVAANGADLVAESLGGLGRWTG